MAQREADVVEAVHEPVLREVVELERHVEADRRRGDALVLDVDDDLEIGILLDRLPQPVHDRVVSTVAATRPIFPQLLRKMSAKRGESTACEAVVHQRPHRVLARRAGAEVRTGDEDLGAVVALLVEHEVGVLAPLREQSGAEAGALDALQPVARDDLVGVDVGRARAAHPSR